MSQSSMFKFLVSIALNVMSSFLHNAKHSNASWAIVVCSPNSVSVALSIHFVFNCALEYINSNLSSKFYPKRKYYLNKVVFWPVWNVFVSE